MCHVEREYNLRIFHFVFYTQTSLDLEKLCLTPNVYRKLIWSGIHNCMIIHPLGVVSSSSVLHDCLTAKQCVSILQDRCALSCNIVPIFQDNNFYTHTHLRLKSRFKNIMMKYLGGKCFLLEAK